MKFFRITSITFFLLIIIIHLFQPEASAHKVSIYAYAEDGRVFAEGYFVDGTRAKKSLIEVFDARSGKKLLEAKTDEKGEASFKIPKVTPLKLVLTASMGHKNDYTVNEEEIREAMGEQAPESNRQELGVKGQGTEEKNVSIEDKKTEISSKEIEALVERVVEKKLLPIKNMLIQIKEDSSRPGINEIFGGIGYILGLMGIVMYFKSRNK